MITAHPATYTYLATKRIPDKEIKNDTPSEFAENFCAAEKRVFCFNLSFFLTIHVAYE